MKSFNKIFIALGLSAFALTSCVDDLNNPLIDNNDLTPDTFAEDPKGYMDLLNATKVLQLQVMVVPVTQLSLVVTPVPTHSLVPYSFVTN